MKKLFLLLMVCLSAFSAMADTANSFPFVGSSEFYLPSMKDASLTKVAKDTLVFSMNNSSITLPDMKYNSSETVKSFTISGLTLTNNGDGSYSCTSTGYTSTTTGTDGATKTITGTSLKATYYMATGTLTLETTFTYGSMPMPLTYEATAYYTPGNIWGLAGQGTSANPYRILTTADLTSMATNFGADGKDGSGEYFQLMNDLDFGGSADTPVQLPAIAKNADLKITAVSGGFNGTFDGNGHSISGIYHTNNANDANGKYNALFSILGKNGVVKNLTMTADNTISSYNYVGSIVSLNMGTIEDCTNKAAITAAGAFAGGICGYMVNGLGTIKNCHNYGDIKAMTYAAGIVCGTQSGSKVTSYNYLVSDCDNHGNLSTTNGTGSAGIAGSYSGIIENCHNYGTVDDQSAGNSKGQYTAGIVAAYMYAVKISGCVNDGVVKGVKTVGGIVASIGKGDGAAVTVSKCSNNGAVTASGKNVAGILGLASCDNVTLESCTNNGVVSSDAPENLIGNLRGSANIILGTDNVIASSLEHLYLDPDAATTIKGVKVDGYSTTDGKYLRNGRVVIVKNGETYTLDGIKL